MTTGSVDRLLILSILACAFGPALIYSGEPIRVVALSGRPTVGIPGSEFRITGTPSIDSLGLGQLQLVALEGSQIEIAPNDVRTIRRVQFEGDTGNQEGLGSEFNDRGQVAFRAEFTDGAWGVLISDLVAIPEPEGATHLVAWTMLVTWMRCRNARAAAVETQIGSESSR